MKAALRIVSIGALCIGGAASAQTVNRAFLNATNNSYFYDCFNNCITGSKLNTFNGLLFTWLGVLNDNNTWTAANAFAQYPTFTAASATNGLDLTATAFTGCAFKSTGFCVTPTGVPQNPAMPGLTDNNSGTGYPGMLLPSTSSWFINQVVTDVPTTNIATLRLQRDASYTGGLAANGIFGAFTADCYARSTVTGNEWCGKFVMNDYSSRGIVGGSEAQLALNVTYFKNTPTAGGTSLNVVAADDGTPDGGDVGIYGMATTEYDVFGNGTDSHNRRAGVWVVNGLRGSGTAMQAAYAITVNNNDATAVWKNGLYLGQWFDDATSTPIGPTSNFVNVINLSRATASAYQILGKNWGVTATGAAAFNTTDGSWSSNNFLKNILIGTQSSPANPSIGIGDNSSTNFFALANAAGTFEILSMPGVNDSTTAPIVSMQVAHSTGGVLVRGPTGGGAPSAGMVGEEIESSIPIGSAVAMTSTTPANITSVNLTAGNWLCYGSVSTAPAGGTTTSAIFGSISDTSATFPTQPNDGAWVSDQLSTPAGASVTHPVGQRVYRTASPMTVYLVATYNFAGGTMGGYGYLGCFRQF